VDVSRKRVPDRELNKMGVDLNKMQAVAPHLVPTINMVKGISLEKGMNPDSDKAQVVGTFDFSESTEWPGRELYSNGTMESVSGLASAIGFTFDDDGEIPYSLFHNRVIDLDNLTPETSKGFITRAWHQNRMGGTAYIPALKWIIKSVGLGDIDLGRRGEPLRPKFTSPIPVYAYFVTDGEPNDSARDIEEFLRRMSQLPIYVQFIGVGNHNFEFLRGLDDLDGRLIDNAGFFDSKDIIGSPEKVRQGFFGRKKEQVSENVFSDDQKQKMLQAMLKEFPSYYRDARRLGLVDSALLNH
jgi:hypothetical protein